MEYVGHKGREVLRLCKSTEPIPGIPGAEWCRQWRAWVRKKNLEGVFGEDFLVACSTIGTSKLHDCVTCKPFQQQNNLRNRVLWSLCPSFLMFSPGFTTFLSCFHHLFYHFSIIFPQIQLSQGHQMTPPDNKEPAGGAPTLAGEDACRGK